ncbi:UNVERIFIED_CONTAM: hypothetical protein PYX00_000758 [Menopon gallinae]|uniref:CCHC-type domain-containing protein n=1 Tax=Menopon gallinae TaxID=328185 RepID=A0AAW2IA94_9NEOP
MKKSMNPEDFGVKVQGIKKMPNEGVRVIIKEGKPGGTINLIQAIQEKVKIVGEITRRSRVKKIIIKDLDDSTDQEDILKALTETAKRPRTDFKVNNIHRTPGGAASVLVTLPEDIGTEIVNRKNIKIGWTYCRVSEKMESAFCSRCQNFGHNRYDCKSAPARGIRCLKCGETGHIARNCSGNQKCFNCDVPDHRADSLRCPKYAQYIEKAGPAVAVGSPNTQND